MAADAGVPGGAGGRSLIDLLEPAQLRAAMEGVESVVHIGPLFHHREADIGHAVVAEARRHDVRHFVQFSVVHPQIEQLLNHQAKLAVERAVIASPVPFTILQPMHYLQNIDIAGSVAAGVYAKPHSAESRLAHVDLEDVTEVAARVTGDPRHQLSNLVSLERHRLAEAEFPYDIMYRLFGHCSRYGITGNCNVLSWLLGRPPTTLRQYVQRELDAAKVTS